MLVSANQLLVDALTAYLGSAVLEVEFTLKGEPVSPRLPARIAISDGELAISCEPWDPEDGARYDAHRLLRDGEPILVDDFGGVATLPRGMTAVGDFSLADLEPKRHADELANELEREWREEVREFERERHDEVRQISDESAFLTASVLRLAGYDVKFSRHEKTGGLLVDKIVQAS